MIADNAYSSRGFRAYLRRRGIGHTIPEKNDQRQHRRNRGSQGGRPAAFDLEIYRRRNTVERCFNQLKGFRGIATRYEKTAASYEAAVTLASLLLGAGRGRRSGGTRPQGRWFLLGPSGLRLATAFNDVMPPS